MRQKFAETIKRIYPNFPQPRIDSLSKMLARSVKDLSKSFNIPQDKFVDEICINISGTGKISFNTPALVGKRMRGQEFPKASKQTNKKKQAAKKSDAPKKKTPSQMTTAELLKLLKGRTKKDLSKLKNAELRELHYTLLKTDSKSEEE